MRIWLREAKREDIEPMVALFQGTVKTVNAADYTLEEVDDWAACGESKERWEELMSTLYFVVAEVVEGKSNRAAFDNQAGKGELIGFASIAGQGYLHSMFVHKNYQGCGVATALLRTVEEYASQQGVTEIQSEVSITARPFFEKKGYRVILDQRRKAKNLELRNFVMTKILNG